MPHVDEGELHAHLDGALATLDPARAAATARHLGACDACRERLEQARDERDRATAILRSADPAAAPIPAFETVRARGRTTDAATPRPRRRMVALGWAASIALALGAGWLARGGSRAAPVQEVAVQEAPAAVSGPAAAEPDAIEATTPDRNPTAEPAPEPVGAAEPTRAPLDSPRIAVASSPPPPPATPEPRPSIVAAAVPAPARPVAASGELVVRGTVTDAHGRALTGAQVTVPGLSHGVISDREGQYALTIPRAAVAERDTLTVVAQLIGMHAERRQVPIAAAKAEPQNFRLVEQAVALEAVVVTTGTAAGVTARAQSDAPAARRREFAAAAVEWRPAEPAEAARWLAHAPLRVAELPVLAWEVATAQGVPVVRVWQRLEAGGVLVLTQLPSGTPASARAAAAPGARITVQRGGLDILAEALLPADSLHALLARLH